MKIGIIQTRPGIGDICIFLPFIHLISKFYKLRVCLFTKKRSAAKEILKDDPFIQKVIYIDENNETSLNKNLYYEIKKNKINKIFIFHFGIRYWLISFFAGVKNIKFNGIFKRDVSITGYLRSSLMKWLNIDNIKYECKIYLNSIKKNKSIIIGIGGSGPAKKWRIQNYIKLIKLINILNSEFQFVIAGGNQEIEDFKKIKNDLPNINFKNLCELSISDCMDILNQAELYIGNDTGFMHICGSLNIPSFGIFGNTPNDYCDYNELLFPIMPDGYEKVGFQSDALDIITPDYVYKFIKNKGNYFG